MSGRRHAFGPGKPWKSISKHGGGTEHVAEFDDEASAREHYNRALAHAREHGGNIELRHEGRPVSAYEGRADND